MPAPGQGAVTALLDVFAENFRQGRELGASVSVWRDGGEIIRHGRGWCEPEKRRPWTPDTLVPVHSAGKGPAAAALLLALERHGLGPQTPVREVWPGFPVAEANFAQLLSHQCGLAALDHRVSVWEHAAAVEIVEAQVPLWPLGEGHGYHPRTFGVLVDEPVRRLTGQTLSAFWRWEIALPLGLDLWFGVPVTEFHRIARLSAARQPAGWQPDAFQQALLRQGTLTWRAFHAYHELGSIHEMNSPRVWGAGLPAISAVASATALARFYQAAIGAIPSPLSANLRHSLATAQSAGPDRVLLTDTVFTCGCQLDPLAPDGSKLRDLYGPSAEAFGHPGAGGSHAFGDPLSGLSFAYVMNRMEPGRMPGPRCRKLVTALFA